MPEKIPVDVVKAFGQALQDYSYLVVSKVPVKVETFFFWLLIAALATGMAQLGFDAQTILLVVSVMGALLNGLTSKIRLAQPIPPQAQPDQQESRPAHD